VRLTVVARSNYEAVKKDGMKIISANHGEQIYKPFAVVKSPSEAPGHYDFVVCANKAMDLDEMSKTLAPVVDDKTTIVIIQNGVGNEESFRAAFPKSSIISCAIWTNAIQISPGVVQHFPYEGLSVGLYPNPSLDPDLESARLAAFSNLLTLGKTPFTIENNVQIKRWEKLIWNVAWNCLTTLTQLQTHEWLSSSPSALPMTRKLMLEVISVARQAGIPLRGEELADELVERILAMHTVGTSMLTDLQNGRPLELDAILGVPIRKGREFGCEMPTMEIIYTLLLGIDSGLRSRQAKSV